MAAVMKVLEDKIAYKVEMPPTINVDVKAYAE